MPFPTPGEYQDALQFPQTAFSDPQLQAAEPETNILGLPRAVTGAFAVVFPVQSRGGARWALKCFLTDVPDQHRRYRAIGEALRSADLPYTAAFEYQPEGIRVAGQPYPLLKMEWLEGQGLNAYVAERVGAGRSQALADLVCRWRTMMDDLEAAGIAHGDLQHGNVLADGDRLRLVDYDTMFVPALSGRKSAEVGHRNYQHPDRDEHDFGMYVDRFSALLIDSALQACARRPDLWERYDTGENMLFRSDDLADPSASVLFDELRDIDEIRAQIDALERACFLEPEQVPPLADIVTDSDAVPVPTPSRVRKPREGDGTRSLKPHGPFERFFLPAVLIAALAIVGIGSAVGWTSAAVLFALLAAAGFGLVAAHYRRLPPVRRRRRLIREDAYFRRLIAGLRDELEQVHRRREKIFTSQQSRMERRLQEIRVRSLHDRLKHHFVGEIRGFEGLTHKVVVRLKAAGIRTAAHATAERVDALQKLSPESKARVQRWRAELAARYDDDIPKSLSPAEERRLRRYTEKQVEEIDRVITRLEDKIVLQSVEHDQIRERLRNLDAPTPLQYVAFLLRAGATWR